MRYLRNVKNYGNRGIVVKEQSWDEVDHNQVYKISKAMDEKQESQNSRA